MTTYQKFYGQFEHTFIGSCTLGVLAQSCLGSIAAMSVLTRGTSIFQMIQLFIVIATCMAFNGAVLSLQKPKVTFNLLLLSAGVSIVTAAFNFLH